MTAIEQNAPGPARKQGLRGYSVTELLVVVGVLGVLAAIAIPQFTRIRAESRRRQAEIDLQLLSTAIGELAWDTGAWPGGTPRNASDGPDVWDLSAPSAGLLATDGSFARWQGSYIATVPRDPWGKDYFFVPDYPVGGRSCAVVGSFGPNQRGKNEYDDDDVIVVLK
jgi:general secretion pathway protein G